MIAQALAHLHATSGMDLRPWSVTEYETLLADPKTIFVNDPMGFAIGSCIFDQAELLLIITRPEFRGMGHGARVLSQFELNSRDRGAASILLEVSEQNASARRLYDRHGYTQIGTRRHYYKTLHGERQDAVILRKEI